MGNLPYSFSINQLEKTGRSPPPTGWANITHKY